MNKRLIAVDGLDGSGKETQTKLILEKFASENVPYRYLSFPTYKSPWCDLVDLYLGGGFGSSPEDVNAYAASTFFACDRYCSYMLDWKRDYDDGKIIVCNRYTTGNAVHQLSKLPESEWEVFLEWLNEYEHKKLGLPKPDTVIYLCLTPDIAMKYIKKRAAETGRAMDIHEKSADHLEKSYRAAKFAASRLGWKTVECSENNAMRPIEHIQQDIQAILKNEGYII